MKDAVANPSLCPVQLAETIARYFAIGFTEQVIGLSGPDPIRTASAAAEALPELRRSLVR